MHKRSWKVNCATDVFAGKAFSMAPAPNVLHAIFPSIAPGTIRKDYKMNHDKSAAVRSYLCGGKSFC